MKNHSTYVDFDSFCISIPFLQLRWSVIFHVVVCDLLKKELMCPYVLMLNDNDSKQNSDTTVTFERLGSS